MVVWCLGLAPAIARAEPINFPIVYTTGASPPLLRSATLTYDPDPGNGQQATASVSASNTIATLTPGYAGSVPAGADGIALGSDGAYYAVSALSNIHRVQLSPTTSVSYSIVSLAASTPPPPSPLGSLRLEPGQTHAWAIGRGSANRIARVRMGAPIAAGISYTLSGDETAIHDVCFVSGRAYYSSPGGNGSIGVIDATTFATTRLKSNLAAAAPNANPATRASTILCDPLTGHLLLIGHDRITQIDVSVQSPLIVSERVLSSLIPNANLVAATVDGNGHLVALSSTGHIAIIDYSVSGLIGSPANIIRALAFDPLAGNLIPLSGPGALRTSEKLWDNGGFDMRNGQYSTLSAQSGDGRTADDFTLEPGAVYRIDSLQATLFTNTPRPKARIELYEDCNGKPGALVGAWDASVTPTGSVFSGFSVYTITALTPNLWLDAGHAGKVYWVVPIGISDPTFPAQWYWATTRNQAIIGTPGAFKGATLGFPDWTSVSGLPCGCTDFAFRVDGHRCETIRDNGPAAPTSGQGVIAGAPILRSALMSSTRAADDFVLKPNTDALVCYLRAIVYTNCSPVDGTFELHTVTCGIPNTPASGTPIVTAPFARATDLGYDITYQGETLRAYRVEAYDFAWYLLGGYNYALSVSVRGAGSMHQRAVWAFADHCETPGCLVRFNQAMVQGSSINAANWKPISQSSVSGGVPRDLSYLVAGSLLPRCGTGGGSGGGSPPPCPADVNRSGTVDADDIFWFLDMWFTGCP